MRHTDLTYIRQTAVPHQSASTASPMTNSCLNMPMAKGSHRLNSGNPLVLINIPFKGLLDTRAPGLFPTFRMQPWSRTLEAPSKQVQKQSKHEAQTRVEQLHPPPPRRLKTQRSLCRDRLGRVQGHVLKKRKRNKESISKEPSSWGASIVFPRIGELATSFPEHWTLQTC